MNFLAHLVLGRSDEGLMVGNLLGDFVRGDVGGRFPGRVGEGVRMHRAIDAFVDSHPAMHACRRLVAPERRRFAGIIADISFDHFLSVSWAEFVPEIGRLEFIEGVYQALDRSRGFLPEVLVGVLPRMRSEDWLGCYATVEGIGLTLERVSYRSERIRPVADGIVDLRSHFDGFGKAFSELMPDVVSMCEDGRW